jgi:hypothetical protein
MTLRPLTGWPMEFTSGRRKSPFSAGFSDTIGILCRELRAIDPKDRYYPPSVLQIALREQDFRLDGMPRASAVPEHPGVILNIEPRNKPALSFPCDAFTHWHDNLRAVALGLEALRRVDRYGITQTGQQYRGWQAIEAKPSVDVTAAACALLARVAWPNERPEFRDEWAPSIATDPEIGRNTLKKARANAHPDRHDSDQLLWNEVEQAASVLGLLS